VLSNPERPSKRMKVIILIPVYNDWGPLAELLSRLGETLQSRTEQFHLLLVDDASEDPLPSSFLTSPNVFSECTCLRLRCNVGHQRAIAVGLTWLYHNEVFDVVVVMDGDGEDKPEDVPRLLYRIGENGGTKAVFAERTRRSEGFRFAFFYKLYQLGHRLLTGLPVKIGNFSVLPGEFLGSLVISNHLWNHYAATVVRLRLGMTTVPTKRGLRYQGRSKMNFVSLVRHGLSALAVHSELVAVRLLVATGAFCVIGVALLAGVIFIRLFTPLAVPGWATYVSGFIAIILLQILSITFAFTIHTFSDLNSMAFLPIRDYTYFIGDAKSLPVTMDASSGIVGTCTSVYG
jgi:glycosyltransferase involved in cell wall biosynthesis